MNDVTMRFYGELNDFLQPGQKQRAFRHYFYGRPSVKDLIESLGVPHTEVDLLLINGESSSFGQHVQGGEWVTVYPVFKSLDISALSRVRPEPISHFCFILDVHLGQLALYLRMFGFDSLYRNEASDDYLADTSSAEKRILLTFDRGLLKRKKVTYGYCVRSRKPSLQLLEVLQRFDLFERISPFKRCLRCNGVLRPVPKESVLAVLPEKVRHCLHEFQQCPQCGQVYWKGSHYDHMQRFIQKILAKSTCGS